MSEHIEQCRQRFDAGSQHFDRLIQCTDANTAAVRDMVARSEAWRAETEGVVRLYSDLQAAARMGVRIQKVAAWIAKWPLIGGGLIAGGTWLFHKIEAWL